MNSDVSGSIVTGPVPRIRYSFEGRSVACDVKQHLVLAVGTQQQWYTRGTLMRPYDHPAGTGIGDFQSMGFE